MHNTIPNDNVIIVPKAQEGAGAMEVYVYGKQLGISMYDLIGLEPQQVDEHILNRLESAGFDMTKPIDSYEDFAMNYRMYRQRTEIRESELG